MFRPLPYKLSSARCLDLFPMVLFQIEARGVILKVAYLPYLTHLFKISFISFGEWVGTPTLQNSTHQCPTHSEWFTERKACQSLTESSLVLRILTQRLQTSHSILVVDPQHYEAWEIFSPVTTGLLSPPFWNPRFALLRNGCIAVSVWDLAS